MAYPRDVAIALQKVEVTICPKKIELADPGLEVIKRPLNPAVVFQPIIDTSDIRIIGGPYAVGRLQRICACQPCIIGSWRHIVAIIIRP
jgi:hypothetical protein